MLIFRRKRKYKNQIWRATHIGKQEMDGQPLKGLKAHGFYREMGLLLMT